MGTPGKLIIPLASLPVLEGTWGAHLAGLSGEDSEKGGGGEGGWSGTVVIEGPRADRP